MGWIKDAKAMIDDLRRVSPFMRVWGPSLNGPMVLGGLVFISHYEAVLILISCVISVLFAAQIHKRSPFSRLTSLVHIVWLPLFPLLLKAVSSHGVGDIYGIWLGFVTVTMGISLAFDVLNTALYLLSKNNKFEGADA
jgi:hypothetical protein